MIEKIISLNYFEISNKRLSMGQRNWANTNYTNTELEHITTHEQNKSLLSAFY